MTVMEESEALSNQDTVIDGQISDDDKPVSDHDIINTMTGELEKVGGAVRSRQALPLAATWGPYPGRVELNHTGSDTNPTRTVAMVITGDPRWLHEVTSQTADEGKSTCEVYSKEDIFPCKACGIWFRSEQNLQAHLMHYCSAQQQPISTGPKHHMTYPQCHGIGSGQHAMERLLSLHQGSNLREPQSARASSRVRGTLCPQKPSLEHPAVGHRDPGERGLQSPAVARESSPTAGSEQPQLSPGTTYNTSHPLHPVCGCKSNSPGPSSAPTAPDELRVSSDWVKSEPYSPRHASSPIHAALGASPFLPHFPLSKDVTTSAGAAGPQASAILAKMSELVHRRVRHGGGPSPSLPSSNGVSCLECSISFSSLENYLVHKKHYCRAGWHLLEKLQNNMVADTGSTKASLNFQPIDRCLSTASLGLGWLEAGSGVGEGKLSSLLGSSLSGEEMSPVAVTTCGEVAESERNRCQACKITFSREENFLVHKQYYCATRHDPSPRRPHGNKTAQPPPPMRRRNRRKNCEAYRPSANQELAHPHFLGIGPIAGPGIYQDIGSRGFYGNQLPPGYGVYLGMVPKHPDANLLAARPPLASRCNAVAQGLLDSPIDLSRKSPSKMAAAVPKMAALPGTLTADYHECSLCKISFDKVGDYLDHKGSNCPDTLSNSDPCHNLTSVSMGDGQTVSQTLSPTQASQPLRTDQAHHNTKHSHSNPIRKGGLAALCPDVSQQQSEVTVDRVCVSEGTSLSYCGASCDNLISFNTNRKLYCATHSTEHVK
ncbi:zinc finger protein ZFPM2-like [Aplochiton taeniatus]